MSRPPHPSHFPPQEYATLEQMHHLPYSLSISIILKRGITPLELYRGLDRGDDMPEEIGCHTVSIAFAKDEAIEAAYRQIPEHHRIRFLSQQELSTTVDQRQHFRSSVAMEARLKPCRISHS